MRQKLRAKLSGLPVEATVGNILNVCPHIRGAGEKAEAARILALLEGGSSVALSGTCVAGAFHLVRLFKPAKGPARIIRPYAARMKGSFHQDRERVQQNPQYPYVREALEFAAAHWDHVLDDWQAVMAFRVLEPLEPEPKAKGLLVPDTKPRALYAAINIPRDKLISGRVEKGLLATVVRHTTIFRVEGEEMAGGREIFDTSVCAVCGGVVSHGACRGCSRKFSTLPSEAPTGSWALSLTDAMVVMLRQHGHKFAEREVKAAAVPASSDGKVVYLKS